MAIQKITSGIIQDGAIVAADIVSIANTQITGNIVSSQITSVANTQITGNIVSSQITSVANTQISGNIISSQITSVANTQITGNITATTATTATNLAGGSNGTIPYQTASGATSMLAVGTSGQVLQTNGAGAPSWATPSSGALVYLATVTASNSSTVDVENAFNVYDEYLIKATNIVTSDANEQLRARLKMGGSYDISSNYSSSSITIYAASTLYSGNEGGTAIFMSSTVSGSNKPLNFEFRLHQPSSSITKLFDYEGVFNRNGAQAIAYFAGSGLNNLTSACTGVRFYIGTGTLVSGTFRIYGITNS